MPLSQKRMNARHSSLFSASSPASHCMLNSSTNTLCLLRNRWCIAENTSCPPKSKMDMISGFLPPSPPLLISSSNLNTAESSTALADTFAQLLLVYKLSVDLELVVLLLLLLLLLVLLVLVLVLLLFVLALLLLVLVLLVLVLLLVLVAMVLLVALLLMVVLLVLVLLLPASDNAFW